MEAKEIEITRLKAALAEAEAKANSGSANGMPLILPIHLSIGILLPYSTFLSHFFLSFCILADKFQRQGSRGQFNISARRKRQRACATESNFGRKDKGITPLSPFPFPLSVFLLLLFSSFLALLLTLLF